MVNGIVIMARTGSSRLENKVQKEISDTSIIEFVINRIKHSSADRIVLATTNLENDDVLQRIAIEKEIDFFRGSEEDTLDRFYQATVEFKFENVILVESDEVFTDPKLINETFQILDKQKTDCVKMSGFPIGMMHIGLTVEALKKVWDAVPRGNADGWGAKLKEIETVNTVELPVPEKLQKVKKIGFRLTLDYQKDYELINKIVEHFEGKEISYDDLADYLIQNPSLSQINSDMNEKWLKNLNLEDF